MLANQEAMTKTYIPQLEALAPDSGCYLSEVRVPLKRLEAAMTDSSFSGLGRLPTTKLAESLLWAELQQASPDQGQVRPSVHILRNHRCRSRRVDGRERWAVVHGLSINIDDVSLQRANQASIAVYLLLQLSPRVISDQFSTFHMMLVSYYQL